PWSTQMSNDLAINHVVILMGPAQGPAPVRVGLEPIIPPAAFVLEPQPVAPDFATGTVEVTPWLDAFVPAIVSRFVEVLRSCQEVLAVIVEPGSNESDLHVTTFASSLSERVREAVYSAEGAVIDAYAPRTFNFHLRQPEMIGGQPVIPSAPYATHIWRK